MPIVTFIDRPPESSDLTSYDEQHLVTYVRLLDADAEGADWREVVEIIFGLDPREEPERAASIHLSHLRRAQWMTTEGYRHLLEPQSS